MGYITARTSATKGTRYQAAVRVRGKERTKTFRRRLDAQRWLAANETDLARGTYVDPAAGRITLDAYATQWIAGRTNLRESTRQKYQDLLDRHIVPVLGDVPLGRLEAAKVREWYATLHAAHPSTAAGAYRLLSTICKTAATDEVIPRTPCRVSGASVEHAAERPVATVAQLNRAVKAAPERFRLALLLAAWCQLRRGEILGLQRGDVDLRGGTVAVERTWGTTGLGPPKTAAGIRRLAMPPNVVGAAKDHLKKHVGGEDDAWLFPGVGTEPANPRTLDRVWTEARVAAGLEALRLHDLRHTGLVWTATSGATTAELMHRGGHASPVAALRYQHATRDRDRDLAKRLGAMARGRST